MIVKLEKVPVIRTDSRETMEVPVKIQDLDNDYTPYI